MDDHIKSEISAYLAGGLTESRNRQIEAHAGACEKCRGAITKARAKQARVKREALKKASPDPLPNLFLARLGKDEETGQPGSSKPIGLIVGLLVVGGVGFWGYRHFAASRASVSVDPGLAVMEPAVSTPMAKTAAQTPVADPPAAVHEAEPAPVKSPPPAVTAPPKEESKGDESGVKDERVIVVRNADALENLWKEMALSSPMPTVDFDSRMIVGVFAGERPVGTQVTIGTLLNRQDDALVPYSIHLPAAAAAAAVAASTSTSAPSAAPTIHPYLLVSLPRVGKKVRLSQKENPS